VTGGQAAGHSSTPSVRHAQTPQTIGGRKEAKSVTAVERGGEPTFLLRKRFRFEAAHFLPRHPGKCRRMHGHSWVGWVEIGGYGLHSGGPETGMVMDFDTLGSCLRNLVESHLDHYCLNESLGLESPTSEEVARWIYNRLAQPIAANGGEMVSVIIQETCTSECTYRPGGNKQRG
jgi:6-pyruvoyltetrahydropterin/6-carboxytetrahydropterin synthase